MKWLLILLLSVHGLIHLLGGLFAFGAAGLPEISESISPGMGILWLSAAATLLAAALMVLRAPRIWWVSGLAGATLSQVAILSSWSDAWFGTPVNVLVALLALRAFAAEGPLGFRTEYRRQVKSRVTANIAPPLLAESDLSPLPEPVRRYLRVTGSVGRPVARHFKAVIRGRIRSTAQDPWMSFTAEQHNFLEEPARFFLMDARRSGLPVDVLHTFHGLSARMRVRLLSLFPVVNARGPELDKAETVTLFNDLCLFGPSALVDPAIRWESADNSTARGRFTVGSNTISAVLRFNAQGELVDFVSDDRLFFSSEGNRLTPLRWSTPVGDYRDFHGRRIFSRGEGHWHAEEGEYAYLELEVVDLRINGEDRERES
jgi:hypothetical protein